MSVCENVEYNIPVHINPLASETVHEHAHSAEARKRRGVGSESGLKRKAGAKVKHVGLSFADYKNKPLCSIKEFFSRQTRGSSETFKLPMFLTSLRACAVYNKSCQLRMPQKEM